MAGRTTPPVVPVLSRGKHRTPRKGACFMEYASFLAGERWSDHPNCTHPLLASVARGVNDHTSDGNRSQLVESIPAVIGLTGDDPRLDVGIATRCAATALPVVAEHRQRALAVGVVVARQVLADLDDESPSEFETGELFEHAESALLSVPLAARWAMEFTAGNHLTLRGFQHRSAPSMVRVSISGIAQASIPDPDALLHHLLSSTIDDFTRWLEAGARHSRSHLRAMNTL